MFLVPLKYNEKGILPYSRIIAVQFAPKSVLYSTLVFRLAFKQVEKIEMYLMATTGKANLPGISCDFAGKVKYTS